MDALEAIRKRRSVRKFSGEPVSRQDLETIVDAGRLAATGYNRQPWDFIVITQKETMNQLLPSPCLNKASAVIAVVMDPASIYWQEDGAAAVQNMLIAATALGYGSCWLQGDTQPHEENLKELLKIPGNKKLFTLVSVGVPAESPKPHKKPLEAVLHWEVYGGKKE